MQSHKAHKIDLSQDYPCPCRCRGRLSPIALTEAFGCVRCQQIFVLSEGGHVLEKLVTHYPYKQAWRWTGTQWYRAHSGWRTSFLPAALITIGILLCVWLPLVRSMGGQALVWVAVALLLAVLPAFLMWLAYRR